jgi:hypothetical protein
VQFGAPREIRESQAEISQNIEGNGGKWWKQCGDRVEASEDMPGDGDIQNSLAVIILDVTAKSAKSPSFGACLYNTVLDTERSCTSNSVDIWVSLTMSTEIIPSLIEWSARASLNIEFIIIKLSFFRECALSICRDTR